MMIGSHENEIPPSRVTAPDTDNGRHPVIRSEELLGGGSEVAIRHGAETYRLRRTRNGKLILTK